MIKIIKEGKKRFVTVCLNCDARYSYELNDVVGRSVRCPCCGEFCPHYNHFIENNEENNNGET